MKLVLVKWRDSQSYMDTAWFGKAEIKGKILEVLVDNAEPVEFGQPILLVEPL